MRYSNHQASLHQVQRMPASNWQWEDLPWNTPVKLTEEQLKLSHYLASQSTYAEEAGLLIAAKLCRVIEDRDLRRLMAQQAAEEARHSEVFERYAQTRFGHTSPPTPSIEKLLTTLESIENPNQLMLIHTMLEGVALDQFGLFYEAYQGDLLGEIYQAVRTDEANHVAMGIQYLKRALPQLHPDDVDSLKYWCIHSLQNLAGLPGAAELIARTSSSRQREEIENLLRARFAHRVQQIFSITSRKEIR